MNTRQNNKSGRPPSYRKRYIHRDRTVTTLTGNDDDQDPFSFTTGLNDEQQQLAYSAPTPLVAIAPNVNQMAMLPSNYSFGFNSFTGPMNANNNPNNIQNDASQQPYLPPGKNDLEILENLKERIKQGQHEFFRATPTPGALSSIYLGPSSLPEQQVFDARAQELENNGTVGAAEEPSVKRASSSTPAASDSSSKNSVQESKENGRKSTTTTPDNVNNSSLPAKPVSASNGLNKDERPLGRETYPPPEPSASSDINGNNSGSKYYDSRDIRDSVRRGSSGAEYASIRYGPIRDDRRIPPDTRRPEAPYEASHLPRREDYPPVDEYRRAVPPPPLPPPSDRDRYAHPPTDDRYSDRYERLPPAVAPPTPPTQPAASAYSAGFRPDDRERRYDEHRRDGSHGHTVVSNRPLQVHSSRYNENRLQIGESPVAAAAAAERERQAALAAAGIVPPATVASRSRPPPPATRPIPPVDDRDRERERDRDLRPAPPAKLEERISGIGGSSSRVPTLQERLSHPPLDAPSGPLLTRALSLEERLHPPPSGSVTANGTVPTSPPSSKASANTSNAPSGPETSSAPPTSAASTASTTGSISVSDDPRGRPTSGGPVPASASSGSIPTPGPRGYSRPPSVVQDAPPTSRPAYDDRDRGRRDSHGIDVDPPAPYPAYNSGPAPPNRPRYSSPTPSDRERDRHRTYPPPPLQPPPVYDARDRNRDIRESELRERDHHRATSGGAPPSSAGGRDYVYNDTRDRDQRRDWPENDYYRSSSSSTSRPPPSVYPPSAAPLPPGDRDPRDPRSGAVPLATSMASSRSAAWEARGDRDHERRTSGSSAIVATPPPPRGVPGIPNPPSSVADDRDRSYRPDPRYAPPPSSTPISGTPPTYSRVRPRSPSPHRINDRDRDRPLAKRARDDLYPPPGGSYPQPAYTNNAPPPPPPPRRAADYPPPPQAVRDPRDTYYDHRDSRPPLPPAHTQHAGHAEYGRPPPPAGYDRARSPPRTSAPSNYAYRGDPRDMREVRDIRDSRDLRDPRDIREPRDMRDLRDPRDDRRYTMPPPPLPR